MHCLFLITGLLFSSVVTDVFASPSTHFQNRQRISRIRPEADEKYASCYLGICQDVDPYPYVEILEAIKRGTFPKNFFDVYSSPSSKVESRQESDVVQLCSTDGPDTYKPKVMRNATGQYKFIVNVDNNYMQSFAAEICTSEMVETDLVDKRGLKCKQNYQHVLFLTFEDDHLDYDIFNIPTRCGCAFC